MIILKRAIIVLWILIFPYLLTSCKSDSRCGSERSPSFAMLQCYMKYSKARSILLANGWQVPPKPYSPDGNGHDWAIEKCEKYPEITAVCGTGLSRCRMEFRDAYDRKLIVVTASEGYAAEDMPVCNWRLESGKEKSRSKCVELEELPSFSKLRCHMKYPKARSILLANGWQVPAMPAPEVALRDKLGDKYPEITSVSADGFYRMEFRDAYGRKLIVVTSEGYPVEEDMPVLRWCLEKGPFPRKGSYD
ncbi:MAG: hypothetical protein PHH77_04005 [Victivallaceae bacterium]|nr:hypothetical protein [Victivallaceae bacterium]